MVLRMLRMSNNRCRCHLKARATMTGTSYAVWPGRKRLTISGQLLLQVMVINKDACPNSRASASASAASLEHHSLDLKKLTGRRMSMVSSSKSGSSVVSWA